MKIWHWQKRHVRDGDKIYNIHMFQSHSSSNDCYNPWIKGFSGEKEELGMNSTYSQWIFNDEKFREISIHIELSGKTLDKVVTKRKWKDSKWLNVWRLWCHSTVECYDHRNRITGSMWDANWFIRNVSYISFLIFLLSGFNSMHAIFEVTNLTATISTFYQKPTLNAKRLVLECYATIETLCICGDDWLLHLVYRLKF